MKPYLTIAIVVCASLIGQAQAAANCTPAGQPAIVGIQANAVHGKASNEVLLEARARDKAGNSTAITNHLLFDPGTCYVIGPDKTPTYFLVQVGDALTIAHGANGEKGIRTVLKSRAP